MRVRGEAAAEVDVSVFHERASLAGAAEASCFPSVTIAVLVNESYSSSTSTSARLIPVAAKASFADSLMGKDVIEGAWYGLYP